MSAAVLPVPADPSASPALWSPPKPPAIGRYTALGRLLAHPAHLALLVVSMSIIAASGQWLLMLAAVVADVALVRVIAGRRTFRQLIAEIEAADELRAREHARAVVKMAMSESHAAELERLEVIVGSMYRRLGSGPGGESLIEELGPDRLLATYVSLAIAHCRGEALLDLSPPLRDGCHDDPMLSSLRVRRFKTREQVRVRLEEISRHIDGIADLIVLMHEQSAIDRDLVTEARQRIADATCAVDAVAAVAAVDQLTGETADPEQPPALG